MRKLSCLVLAAMLLSVLLSGCSSGEEPQPVGFAAVGEGVTGGKGGEAVTVSSAKDLVKYISAEEPYIIYISGKIELGSKMHEVSSNKTILGLGTDAELRGGGLAITNAKNIIVRNIKFSFAPDDSMQIQEGSENIWIDHNYFTYGGDGLLDTKTGANYITISWNKFDRHSKTALIGHDDTETADRGKLKVTYHHNWFDGTVQRHPRVRFGEVHVFNNYYNSNELYGIGVGVEAQVISENNYFEKLEKPIDYLDNEKQPGYIKDIGSYLDGSGELKTRPKGISWDPATYYEYELDKAEEVKKLVMEGAGVGIIQVDAPK